MTATPRQLLAYTFSPGSRFEGQLVGALERIESGGSMRILDALFVGREPETGEPVAVSLTTDSSAGMVGKLLSFRLDESDRKRTTERVLQGRMGDTARSLAGNLEPGAAVVAILVEHTWHGALDEAITRIGGSLAVGEFVDATELTELSGRLVAV
jgi:hypothetical protein